MTTPLPTPAAIGAIAITSRPLSDYRNMFLLTDDDLAAGTILDCPAGASPFGAQVRVRGGSAVSVDPAYYAPRSDLVAGIRSDLARLSTWIDANPGSFNWEYIGSRDALVRGWEVAADFFLADYSPDGERYVAAALPKLPFDDGQFTLTLSSHLLFCYPDYFTFDDHVTGLLELVRVTSDEVRIFPLIDTALNVYPRLDELRAELAEQGVETELRPAGCMFQPGGDTLLICRRSG